MRKINKANARKLFNLCVEIELLPCKVSSAGNWVEGSSTKNYCGLTFDEIVNAYEYYNCNPEVGRYASYWVENNPDCELIDEALGVLFERARENQEISELPEDGKIRRRLFLFDTVPWDSSGNVCTTYWFDPVTRRFYGEASF